MGGSGDYLWRYGALIMVIEYNFFFSCHMSTKMGKDTVVFQIENTHDSKREFTSRK